jgi:hypothetical protein
MSKLNICAARRPGMTHAAYSRYARDNHARLVLGTEPVSRHLQAYVQQHVYDGCYGPDAPSWRYDSVSHIYAASPADHKAATETPEYKNIVAPDEPRFADPRSALFLMLEEVPLSLPVRGPSSYRLLHYLQQKPGGNVDELHSAWAAAHEALLGEAPDLFAGVRRALLNKTINLPGAPTAPYAGMCELGFLQLTDEAAMSEYVQRIETRLEPLIQRSASFYLLAEAVPVRGTLY